MAEGNWLEEAIVGFVMESPFNHRGKCITQGAGEEPDEESKRTPITA
jgi:hypothetical protein